MFRKPFYHWTLGVCWVEVSATRAPKMSPMAPRGHKGYDGSPPFLPFLVSPFIQSPSFFLFPSLLSPFPRARNEPKAWGRERFVTSKGQAVSTDRLEFGTVPRPILDWSLLIDNWRKCVASLLASFLHPLKSKRHCRASQRQSRYHISQY